MRFSNIPTEDQEQERLFEWAAWAAGQYPELRWMHHVPNGGSRNVIEAAKLRRMGVRRGVPDIFLDVPRSGCHGLRIELKRAARGRTSPEQRAWIEHYNALGYRAVVCRGFEEARAEIENYLGRRP